MPFTEKQPINIHHLIIEAPAVPVRRTWFDPLTDITPEDRSTITSHEGNAVDVFYQKRILEVPQEDTSHLETYLKIARLNKNTDDAIEVKAQMRLVGVQKELTDEEEKYLEKKLTIDPDIRTLKNCKILDYEADNKELLADRLKIALLYPIAENSMDTFESLRIIGYPLELDEETTGKLLANLDALRTSVWRNISLLTYLAKLSVVASDMVTVGESGIELHYKKDLSDLNTTPPIPMVRNF